MSKQRIVKLAKFTARIAILLFVASPLSVAASTISTFERGTERWTAIGDVAGPVRWVQSGGNPGGHIEITDKVLGGVTYFVAPAKFHGNYGSAYGTNLTFDLRQSYTGPPNQFDDSDVILVGGGLTLVFDTLVNPSNNAWTSYAIPLAGLSGWHVSSLTGPLATQEQLLSTLANLTDLEIRAEYQTGPDIGSLDNVSIFSVPDPGSTVLMFGLAVSGFALLQRKLT